MNEHDGPMEYAYEWASDRTGRLSMAADVSSFGTDPKAKKTVMAHLIPNREDAGFEGWYITDIKDGFPEAGHSCVDVRSMAEGKAFLEKWGNEIAMPEMERRDFEHRLLAEKHVDQIKAQTERFSATRGHNRNRDNDRDR